MSDRTEIKKDVNRGLAWIGLASSMVGVLDFLALLIILGLARWVNADDYGIATEAVWMFPILDLATDLGLSSAVIQRDDHTEAKISTVFWLNLAMSLVLFGALVAASPLAAHLYGHAVVGTMLIVYGTKLIWQNVYFIPAAMMRRELRFKELSVIRILANLAEFAGKIGFAAAGYGVWCFVLGPLCRVLVTAVGIQLRHPWRPRFVLRLREAVDYATFGLKTSGSQILFYFYTNVDYPVVGHFFGTVALGLYRLAYEIVLEPVRIISLVIVDIAFPAFARLKHSRDKLIEQFIGFSRMNLVTVISFLALIVLVADDFLAVFFKDYTAAATAVRILAGVGVLRALSFVVPPLLDGMGYPTLTFIYTSVAAVVLPSFFFLSALLFGDRLGYLSVATAWVVGYPIAFVVLAALALRRLELSGLHYLRRVMGIPACAAVAMAAGAVVHRALAATSPGPRLGATTVVLMGVLGLLLAYFQDISPRSVLRALRGHGSPGEF